MTYYVAVHRDAWAEVEGQLGNGLMPLLRNERQLFKSPLEALAATQFLT